MATEGLQFSPSAGGYLDSRGLLWQKKGDKFVLSFGPYDDVADLRYEIGGVSIRGVRAIEYGVAVFHGPIVFTLEDAVAWVHARLDARDRLAKKPKQVVHYVYRGPSLSRDYLACTGKPPVTNESLYSEEWEGVTCPDCLKYEPYAPKPEPKPAAKVPPRIMLVPVGDPLKPSRWSALLLLTDADGRDVVRDQLFRSNAYDAWVWGNNLYEKWQSEQRGLAKQREQERAVLIEKRDKLAAELAEVERKLAEKEE